MCKIYMICMHARSCPTLCDPMDWDPPGFSVHEIFQANYQSGLLFPTLWNLPDPGIGLESLVSPALASGFFINEPPGKLYKTLISEIKEEPNKYSDVPCSWIRTLNIFKMAILPNWICKLNNPSLKSHK